MRPLLIERGASPGGMLRGIRIGSHSLDLGRKELYNRIPEVNALLHELLREDYLAYDHRVGLLYEGLLLEYSSRFRGPLRGAPPAFLIRALKDLLAARMAPARRPASLEEALIQRRGALLTRAFSQGYQEKFTGVAFRDRPPPGEPSAAEDARALETATIFRHPRRGTQEIVDVFTKEIRARGGEFLFGTEIESIALEADQLRGVFARVQDRRVFLPAESVISALPILALARALGLSDPTLERESWNRKRITLIGYFLTRTPISFPHAWLLVSCERMKIARITNYAGFGGAMVPAGEGALAAEIFLSADDPYHERSDDAILDAMERELISNALLCGADIERRALIRLGGAEAANDYKNWSRPAFKRLLDEIAKIRGLFDANRAGIDIAMHAGMEAARALLSGERERFIEASSPTVPYDDFTRLR